MMDEEKSLVINTTTIDNEITDLANEILSEKDPEKTKQLVDLFNWNISKKNTSRILKLNSLYDDVTDQMVARFKNKADQFSNSDVLDYMKAIQGAIDTSTKNLEQLDNAPTIVQQHNTQINVNVVDSFDRDSKERILAAIQQTLKQAAAVEQEEAVVETTATAVDNAINELNSITEENTGE